MTETENSTSKSKPSSVWDRSVGRVRDLHTVPCARESLLGGISSGVGIGFIKGFATGNIRSATNWAVGTFAFISWAAWTICWRNRNIEHQKIVKLIETSQKKVLKKED